MQYDVTIAKTLTRPDTPLVGNFTVFLENFYQSDLDGSTSGHTVATLTPGVRFNLGKIQGVKLGLDNWLMFGVDIPVAGPASLRRHLPLHLHKELLKPLGRESTARRSQTRLLWKVLWPARSPSASGVVQLTLRPPESLAQRPLGDASTPGRHAVRHHRSQPHRTAAVLDHHVVAGRDAAGSGVIRMNLHERLALAAQEARLTGQAAADEMMRRRRQQHQGASLSRPAPQPRRRSS